jgi:hypothetical protein
MALKRLLADEDGAIGELPRWERRREGIRARLFETIGDPPVARNTRSIQVVDEEALDTYVRTRISYVVGEGDTITAFLLRPKDLSTPAPAILALHQTVDEGKGEVVGLCGSSDFAYGHELATRGYLVLAPDHLTAGERILPGCGSFESGPFYDQYPGWSGSRSTIEALS